MTQLIGFCGYPGAGKSEAARYLRSHHGFTHLNIGDFMKEMLRGFYRCSGLPDVEIERRLYGDLKQKPDQMLSGKTPTFALQTLGYEWRNLFSPTLFSERWTNRAACETRVVCDGMRYPDEMKGFRLLNGLLVRIERPGLEETTGHPAEHQPLVPDLVIQNDGTLDELFAKVRALV